MKIIIINGPNLNMLGKREPGIYGSRTFEAYFEELKAAYPQLSLEYYQSNHEGDLVDKIQEVGFNYTGVVLNAGAYTHTSVAITDAIAAVSTPVLEVHISNVHKREAFRHHSYLSHNCVGMMTGFGLTGYRMAIDYFVYTAEK